MIDHLPPQPPQPPVDEVRARELLLAQRYGLLTESEAMALEAFLTQHPRAAELAAEAAREAELLAHAAKVPSPAVSFSDLAEVGDDTAGAGGVRSISSAARCVPDREALKEHPVMNSKQHKKPDERPVARVTWLRVAAVAAAVLVLAALAVFAHEETERDRIRGETIVMSIQAPNAVHDGADAEVLVTTEHLDGTSAESDVRVWVSDGDSGRTLHEETIRTDGVTHVRVPAEAMANSTYVTVAVAAAAPGTEDAGYEPYQMRAVNIARVGAYRLPPPTENDLVAADADAALSIDLTLPQALPLLAAYVSTDRPLYRPGDTVFFRALLLNKFDLSTPGDRPRLTLSIENARGEEIYSRDVITYAGLAFHTFPLNSSAPGGEYTINVTDPAVSDAPAEGQPSMVRFAKATRTFIVRQYRTPRFRTDLEFDRDTYVAGDRVVAACEIERAEGGAPEGAKLTVTATVDGNELELPTGSAEYLMGTSPYVTIAFDLPDTIDVGDGVLSIKIDDGGTVETLARTIPIAIASAELSLFPESGDLIAGFENRVYFSARDRKGEPMTIDGHVVDSSTGESVASFETESYGMGRFAFTPLPGHAYHVEIDKPQGIERHYTLPASKVNDAGVPTGAIIRTLRDRYSADGKISVEVASHARGRHTLIATVRDFVIGLATIDLGSAGQRQTVSIDPVSNVGGVVRLTLLDPDREPVAERLAYRDPARTLNVAIDASTAVAEPASQVTLTFTTTDRDGEPVPAILCVSVVDQANLSLADDEDTPSLPLHYLLGMEVKELEKVELYADDNPKAALAIDRLLGTQGWRRFAWVSPAAFEEEYPEAIAVVLPPSWMRDGVGGFGVISDSSAAGAQASANAEIKTFATGSIERYGRVLGGVLFLFLALFFVIHPAIRRREAIVRTVGKHVEAVRVSWVKPALAALTCGVIAVAALTVPLDKFGGSTMATNEGMVASADSSGDAAKLASQPEAPDPLNPMGPAVAMLGIDEIEEAQWRLRRDLDAENGDDGAWLPDRHHAPNAPADDAPRIPARGGELQGLADGMRPAGEPMGRIAREEMDQDMPDELRDQDRQGWWEGEEAASRIAPYSSEKNPWMPDEPYTVLVREYAHVARAIPETGERTDFTETLYWNAALFTDGNGSATVTFATNHQMTAFRVSVEGHTLEGALGLADIEIKNRLPFFVEPKLPIEVTYGDRIDVPLGVFNKADRALEVSVDAEVGEYFRLLGDAHADVFPDAGQNTRVWYPIEVGNQMGAGTLTFRANAGRLVDAVSRDIKVVPFGYPVDIDSADLLPENGTTEFIVRIPEQADMTSLSGSLRLYPSTLATLEGGLEQMLRKPGGCFEQTSSANYPNVMILNYLAEFGGASPDVVRRANEFLDTGYGRLTGYECDQLGYHWWGGSNPGHSALTAYGVLQFIDMQEVYDVSDEMIERTVGWLMDMRDGEGNFDMSTRALHTWVGKGLDHLNTAYCCWALAESQVDVDYDAEVDALKRKVPESQDPYFLALMANLLILRDDALGTDILQMLTTLQQEDGSLIGTSQSITCSTGQNLRIETTSLAILAWLRDSRYAAPATEAVQWLVKQRQGRGSFGTTQATVLALKALSEHAGSARSIEQPGEIQVFLNDELIATQVVTPDDRGAIDLTHILSLLAIGENRVRLVSTIGVDLPYSLNVNYFTSVPPTDPECALDLSVELASTELTLGDSTRATATITNKTGEWLGMSVAIIGLPAGLETRIDQLKELKKQGIVDQYETDGRNVILYWTEVAPNAVLIIPIDLIAEIPGSFRAPASSAYVYYTDEYKTWVTPLDIEIARGD